MAMYQNNQYSGSAEPLSYGSNSAYPPYKDHPSSPMNGGEKYVPPPNHRFAGAGQQQRAAGSGSTRKRWCIGLAVLLVLAIGGGVAGYFIVKHNKDSKDGGSSAGDHSGPGSNSTAGGPGGSTNSSTPTGPDYSKFDLNPKLVKSFSGIAYTPRFARIPQCGATLEAVIADIQLLSQLTDTIRMYSADCNQTQLVQHAIQLTKLPLKLYLGHSIAWQDHTMFDRQKADLLQTLTNFPTDNIVGITVGNEVMLNYTRYNDWGNDVNSAAAKAGADYIISCINDMRTTLSGLGHTSIKIGNSDAGSFFATSVMEQVDYVFSNAHPWFASLPAARAATWTWNFIETINEAKANALPNKPDVFLAEIGWPTAAIAGQSGTMGGAVASVPSQQTLLDTFLCQSNTKGLKYFWFAMVDEKWKEDNYGGVEGHWGMMTEDRVLKPGITIPKCT